ncbi:hypothetical protein, partial [Nocardia sp. R7R-8]|uniref:hypothetical protein n=1 Tax=Nocardia sp. R7R-8 TaxID=3459304 RepID=UPI00403DC461
HAQPPPGGLQHQLNLDRIDPGLRYRVVASSGTGHDQPVILICSHPKKRQAWWVHVQPWFEVPANRASRRIDFNKATQVFAGDFTGRLFAIVDPHGVAHTPAAERKNESLVSNLLPVDVPDVLYVAKTKHTKPGAVYAVQKESGLRFRSDFVLKGGRIYMWAHPESTALETVPSDEVKTMPFGELADGDADARRLAVWLLNAALKHDLRDDCRWNNSRRFLHFRPTADLSERRIVSSSGRRRLVFKGYYQRKDDPSRPQFYRHAALRAYFSLIDGRWYCEVRPDYYFSDDGYREFKFADKNLAKMKRIEKNQARLSETRMWASFLMGETTPDLFHEPPERILDFGEPISFALDRGITDKHWTAPASDSDGEADDRADLIDPGDTDDPILFAADDFEEDL